MAETVSYVRRDFLPPLEAPSSDKTAWGWARRNLFASVTDSIVTIVAVAIILWFVVSVIDFLLFEAIWTGSDRTVCATIAQGGVQPDGWKGACWAYVGDWFTQFMVGSYPRDQLWRPILVTVLFVGLLVPLLIPQAPRKGLNALLLLIALPLVAYVLLLGGWFGLSHVETSLWGGLMVTLILSFVGIVISLPVGILLALGRRSRMPILKGGLRPARPKVVPRSRTRPRRRRH